MINKKIAVLVSGGVDSSVSLALLKEQGFNITAYYLKIWLEDELSYLGDCPWEEDLEYARKVCKQLDVELNVLSLQKEYFAEVVSYTIGEVKNGRTPNPDVMCNNRIKFGMFLSKIDDNYDYVATGHYAQVEQIGDYYFLKKSRDSFKDQTYFLANLQQNQLKRAKFPIGGFLKSEVRELAEKYDLPNKERKDSQGICFLGKLKFRDFLKHYLGEKEGDLIEFESGAKVGTHPGFWYYTIGQRQNIRLPGGPWYVVQKNSSKNEIFISKNYEAIDTGKSCLEVGELNIIDMERLLKSENLQVKLRHGEKLYNCKVDYNKDSLKVEIDENDQGIAAGQFAVFYENDLCLGCGVIQ